MWVKTVEGVAVPVHYEMRGYNNLLGSHYDHYYVDYKDFSAEVSFFKIQYEELKLLLWLFATYDKNFYPNCKLEYADPGAGSLHRISFPFCA
jgi:hypothetical protein